MKELSIEEKTFNSNYKAYTELVNRLEDVKNAIKKQNYGIAMDILCKPYPEFQVTAHPKLKEKESEDEKIRKSLIQYVKNWIAQGKNRGCVFHTWTSDEKECNEILAWLEKQKTSEEALQYLRENHSLSEVSDFQAAMNIAIAKAYDKGYNDALEKQGEQKPAIIIPKFRVGDEIKTTNEAPLTITKITDSGYWSEDLFICSFGNADKWQLVEQKPTDKDEPMFHEGEWITIKE